MRWLSGAFAVSQLALITSAGIAQSMSESAARANLFGRPLAEWVREAAEDTSVRIRVRATLALSRSGAVGLDAVELLRPRLAQARGESRHWILWALEALQDRAESAVPDILPILDDTATSIRQTALDVLGAIGPKAAAAAPAIERILNRHVDSAAPSALIALSRISPSTVVPHATRLLRDPSPDTREASVNALGIAGAVARASLPELVPLQLDANTSVARAAARVSMRLLATTDAPLEWQMMAEVRDRGRSFNSDGRGPYVNGVDGARSMRRQSLGLNAKQCTGTCDTESSMVPIGGPDDRFLSFDLTHPREGAKNLGRIVDHEVLVYVFWRHDHLQRIHWIRDMPVADSLQRIERVEFRLRVNGRPHILQFGEWAVGEFNQRAPRITGDGTTSSVALHAKPGEWIIRSADRSVGRLWDVSDPNRPHDRGLYDFSFEIRFVDLAPPP